jgi:protein-S-isoprenylcysteine O-methyltransferase Ste14
MDLAETFLLDRQLLELAGAWLLYFAIHSLLASLWLKRRVARRWPEWMPAYRLLFNLQALLLLLPPLYLTYIWDGPFLWQWQGWGWWLANGLALLAAGLFLWSAGYYDSGEFLGLKQWREQERRVEDQEQFHISPLHRFVRHPWYSLGLVLIWTRDMNLAFLLTGLLITLYLVLGSRLEERKLMEYHGVRYRRYRERVPGLIPIPWRYLTRSQAEELQRDE